MIFKKKKKDKKKHSTKRSNAKSKANSGNRSLSKYNKGLGKDRGGYAVPHTTRKEQFPFEYKLNSKASENNSIKGKHKSDINSSKISAKISSWGDIINT